MENKKDRGLTIIVADELIDGRDLMQSRNDDGLRYQETEAIMKSLCGRYEIEVVAFSLCNAIEKMLYRLNALEGRKREFFLEQIAYVIIGVRNKCNDIDYKASPALRTLIREDKMYRIESHEKTIKKEQNEISK